MRTQRCRTALLLAAVVAWIALPSLAGGVDGGGAADGQAPAPPTDPLAALGHRVTGGAAPGYVDDGLCSMCHRNQAIPYREVGMARSFYRPRPETDIEDFDHSRFTHRPSHRTYEMVRRGDDLLFRRYQVDESGEKVNLFEQKVDWVMGSGNHARVYLYRTAAGDLYQLPVAWYTEERSWGMAPGYDRPDHPGVLRRVTRHCMFCHDAYPDVPAGSDTRGAPETFPADLPEGIGCQRCHGPGAEHVRRALVAPTELAAIRGSIVNPARLSPQRRDDVCYECHLLPAVAMPGVLRFGRGAYSFRPGEDLADYRVEVDPREAKTPRSARFEIDHHPYRLRQSRCFVESEKTKPGSLSCLTCHDPHHKEPEATRAAHYRAACLTCHAAEDCTLAAHRDEAPPGVDPGDCVSCHMPKRRTRDVVHVVMTDHLIRRRPGGADLLAPLAESEPDLVGVDFYFPERAPKGALGEVYRALAVLRVGPSAEAVDHLEKALAAARPQAIEPWLDLARGELREERFGEALGTLGEVFRRSPDDPQAAELRALALAGLGKTDQAVAELELSLSDEGAAKGAGEAKRGARPEAHLNLGRLLIEQGRMVAAEAELGKALAGSPNLLPAWIAAGGAEAALGQRPAAERSFRRALALDPSSTTAYLGLARVLEAQGKGDEARRLLAHGVRVAAEPEPLRKALAAAAARAKPASP